MESYDDNEEQLSRDTHVQVYKNSKYYCIAIIACTIGLAVPIWLISLSPPKILFIYICIWFFVILFISLSFAVRVLFFRGPALLLNRQGILIGSLPTTFSEFFIAWNEVKCIALKQSLNVYSLEITLKDPKAYFKRLKAWEWIVAPGLFLSGGRVIVYEHFVKPSVYAVFACIVENYAEDLRRNSIDVLPSRKVKKRPSDETR